jgi:hypothetical protein
LTLASDFRSPSDTSQTTFAMIGLLPWASCRVEDRASRPQRESGVGSLAGTNRRVEAKRPTLLFVYIGSEYHDRQRKQGTPHAARQQVSILP